MEKTKNKNYREQRAKLNIAVSFFGQFILVICGLITPRVLLGKFGSEIYGITTSITTFLGYIIILEGGIGGVAKAALYKPIAEKDWDKMSMVMSEVRRYFLVIAGAFFVHVVIMACIFHRISHVEALDRSATFLLVLVISISSFAEYFIGISNSVFLQADQKMYISNLLTYAATVLNMIMIVLLTRLDISIIAVKFCSSLVFSIKPLFLYLYVKKNYKLRRIRSKEKLLKDKWVGLGQHLAYFLHNNTDIFVLTLFSKPAYVAIYGVHFMVASQIQKITATFCSGMDSVFGDMYAKKEKDALQKTFGMYETIITLTSIILFSVTAIMLVSFVSVYTKGLKDSASYHQPVFAVLLVLASLLTQLSAPYNSMVIAAGHFRQTRLGAYGEAIINATLSIALIWNFGLVGIALGTVISTMFRFVYYAIYLSKNILMRPIGCAVKRMSINALLFAVMVVTMSIIINRLNIQNFFIWAAAAAVVTLICAALTLVVNMIFYREDCLSILSKLIHFRPKKRADIQ